MAYTSFGETEDVSNYVSEAKTLVVHAHGG